VLASAIYWKLSVRNFIQIRSDLTLPLYDVQGVSFFRTLYSLSRTIWSARWWRRYDNDDRAQHKGIQFYSNSDVIRRLEMREIGAASESPWSVIRVDTCTFNWHRPLGLVTTNLTRNSSVGLCLAAAADTSAEITPTRTPTFSQLHYSRVCSVLIHFN